MSIPFLSDIDLNGNKLLNVHNAENDNDIVKKLYVDTAVNNLNEELLSVIDTKYADANSYTDDKILLVNNRIDTLDGDIQDTINASIGDSCVNSVYSTATNKPLAANVGKTLNTSLIGLSNNLEVLEGRVTDAETSISTNTTDISTNTTSINTINQTLTTIKPNNYSSTNIVAVGTYNGRTLYRTIVPVSTSFVLNSGMTSKFYGYGAVTITPPTNQDMYVVNAYTGSYYLDGDSNVQYFGDFSCYIRDQSPTTMLDVSVMVAPLWFHSSFRNLYYGMEIDPQTGYQAKTYTININFIVEYVDMNE